MTGSPPPAALKKLVAKKWSVNSMVTAPASTGMTAISRKAVISQVHTNSGMRNRVIPGARILMMVAIILMEPMMEEIPIMWIENTTNAKLSPDCRLNGG